MKVFGEVANAVDPNIEVEGDFPSKNDDHMMPILDMKMSISLDQNKLFVSESLVPLTQLAKWYKEPTKQFSEL